MEMCSDFLDLIGTHQIHCCDCDELSLKEVFVNEVYFQSWFMLMSFHLWHLLNFLFEISINENSRVSCTFNILTGTQSNNFGYLCTHFQSLSSFFLYLHFHVSFIFLPNGLCWVRTRSEFSSKFTKTHSSQNLLRT